MFESSCVECFLIIVVMPGVCESVFVNNLAAFMFVLFKCFNVCLRIWVPYCRTVLQCWTNKGVLCNVFNVTCTVV